MLYTSNNRFQQIMATRKGASLSVAGITLFMVVLMLLLAILPAYRSITDQLKNNEAKLIYLNELKLKRENMDALNEEYSLNENKIKLFEKYNNTAINSEVILANMNSIALKNNCRLLSLTFDDAKPPEENAYTEFTGILIKPANIVFMGTLADLSTTIKDIEMFPVAINISTINYRHYTEIDQLGMEEVETLISSDPRFTMEVLADYYIWSQDTQL